MKLDEIASISGKPGLFKILKPGNRMIVLESLIDGKRFPLHRLEAVSTLDSIALFTLQGELPLAEVFYRMYSQEEPPISAKSGGKALMQYLEKIIPDYDADSVYASHVKKIIKWYEVLLQTGFDFDQLNPKNQQEEKEDNANE